ncbi:hypothetical protein WN55_08316 [Dufourea novaeangliae]|uniref:Uncharacterized protein n=1 Tax=Dufourea novaeangliae TaxID=178035 RepID=A0A154P6I5_DUFNO|nr:hypothetical protein WN55_08316 [Dufourea novaeangliae]
MWAFKVSDHTMNVLIDTLCNSLKRVFISMRSYFCRQCYALPECTTKKKIP